MTDEDLIDSYESQDPIDGDDGAPDRYERGGDPWWETWYYNWTRIWREIRDVAESLGDHDEATSGVHGVGDTDAVAGQSDVEDHADATSDVHGVGEETVASTADVSDIQSSTDVSHDETQGGDATQAHGSNGDIAGQEDIDALDADDVDAEPAGSVADHAGDDTNPHNVTADQADALSDSGGTATGKIAVNSDSFRDHLELSRGDLLGVATPSTRGGGGLSFIIEGESFDIDDGYLHMAFDDNTSNVEMYNWNPNDDELYRHYHEGNLDPATFLSDGDGVERQVWEIEEGESDPSGADPEDWIFEFEAE